MAAVVPVPMNGNHETEKDIRAEHSPSRFTAVNGRDCASINTSAMSSVPIPCKIVEGKDDSASIRETPGQTTNSIYADLHPQKDPTPGTHQADEISAPLSPSASPQGNRNKRKRSESPEYHSSSPPGNSQSQPRSSPDHRSDEQSDIQLHNGSLNSGAGSHPTTQQNQTTSTTSGYPHTEPVDNQQPSTTNPSWTDYDSNLVSKAQKAQTLDSSDAQLAEALQRETQGSEVSSKSWDTLNRGSEAGGDSDQRSYQTFSQDRPQTAVQVGPKRKRVFSNRTKTGCMTCRRRKKKCDEQHPACNNCIRGGFLCEGYSSRGTWQKPSTVKGPIPLQSKDGYSEIAAHYMPDLSSSRQERPPPGAQPLEATKVRPVEDADRAAPQYMSSPPGNAPPRNAWPKHSWPTPGHPAYMTEHMPKTEYREVPPFHELSRDGQPKSEYPVVPPIRDLPHTVHPKPGISLFQTNVDQRPPHTNTMDTSSPQAQARMALSIEHQLSARQPPGEESERDKMIRGELYRPFDMQLVEDRERCKSALWRFNNACNPHCGVSTKEQNRLLRDILMSSSTITSPQTVSPSTRPMGSIGQGAVVEAPFKCHYGYNIHIGEDVMISENCSLIDDCPINIGAHTWVGPNVTILGSMAHANMQERKGSQSRYQGRAVTIEEDCYVGANCIIYPGVRLRRGAYVAPGEVVKSDIVAYGFQGLKPSYM